MRKSIFLMLGLCLMFSAYESEAQLSRNAIKRNNKRMYSYRGKKHGFPKQNIYNMMGVSLSALNYYGDLAPKSSILSTDLTLTRPAIGFVYGHRFGPRYALSGSFTYGTLRGSDAQSADRDDEDAVYRANRNLSFRNRIKELSITASFDLWENTATYISRVKWTPYVYAGVAVFHHNPQARVPQFQVDGVTPLANAGEWVNLQKLGTEGQRADLRESDMNHGAKPYKLIQPAIPFGLGARFRVNQLMDFSVEFGFRYLFTDYIDDVSKHYVDLGVFGTDELAKAMSYRTNEVPGIQGSLQNFPSTVDGGSYMLLPGYGSESEWNLRGNRNDRDIYTVTSFKLTYIYGKTYNRAKFR